MNKQNNKQAKRIQTFSD